MTIYAISMLILIISAFISFVSLIMVIMMLINKIKKEIRYRIEAKKYEEYIRQSKHFEDDGAYADDEIE